MRTKAQRAMVPMAVNANLGVGNHLEPDLIEADAGERGNHGRVRVLGILEGGFPRATGKESRAMDNSDSLRSVSAGVPFQGDRWLDDLMRYVIQAALANASTAPIAPDGIRIRLR